jgi:biotin synthase
MSKMPYFEELQQPDDLIRKNLIGLIINDDPQLFQDLRAEADLIRHQWVGDAVQIRGIIEFSNFCVRSCCYCGLNRNNHHVQHYRIPAETIVATAQEAVRLGFKTVVLQSGDDFFYSGEMLAEIVGQIKKSDIAVTLSVGERPLSDYRLWREAGADRYLLKFETSDPELYRRLHPGSSLAQRLKCLEDLKSLDYQVGSGFMIGLPGQTDENLAEDLLLMRSLQLEMAGIGPFIPHPSTPLGNDGPGNVTLSLKVLALARLLLPWAHLPATTALSSLERDGRRLGLTGGANVLMPNLTPVEYRKLYEIYPHKAEITDSSGELYRATLNLIRDLGREVAEDQGHGLLKRRVV